MGKKITELLLDQQLPAALAHLVISDLVYDSRKAKDGVLFFAIPGFKTNGSVFAEQAIHAGALACVVEKNDFEKLPEQIKPKAVPVENVRKVLAQASACFFGRPSEKMLVLGITGTKGKTSTSYLLESILKASGHVPALLGTVVCRYPGVSFHSERTTMESYELQKFLHDAHQAGADSVVMEVSSHALSLHRVAACLFDGVLFTNLSEDHLDFYGDMESYFEAKKLLFTEYFLPKKGKYPLGAINGENLYGEQLLRDARTPSLAFGSRGGDVFFASLSMDASGLKGELSFPEEEKIAIQSKLTGNFNAQNIAGAAALAYQLGISLDAIQSGISLMEGVDGRLERIPSHLPFQVFVDFAHMGAALENVLSCLRPLCAGELIVVFGAGGDRDPSRRVQLGSVAARMADYAVITSDNPRTEDPAKIIAAIEAAYLKEKGKEASARSYEIVPERREAIRTAIQRAKAGDIICIAGKGHETGQIIGNVEYPFDDREEAARYLREREQK